MPRSLPRALEAEDPSTPAKPFGWIVWSLKVTRRAASAATSSVESYGE